MIVRCRNVFRPCSISPKDSYGSLSPLVPVRALPRAGHAVFPLRSRPAVLQPIVLARRPPRTPRHSARRYQDSRSGRLKHAARTACWRRRQRCLCLASAGTDVNKVTHYGCASLRADASLPACETTNACEPIDLTSSASDVAPMSSATAALAAPRCRLCGCALLHHVRLGWLRGRGVARFGRHDHRP